ncbi:hypothetical protein HJD18_03465 [Thermoleophilia bacterium SCSIO 60948]|nr:hypothetical protein HJD18_03465 [Thermoleophilia bacterium SCSIO 60948]
MLNQRAIVVDTDRPKIRIRIRDPRRPRVPSLYGWQHYDRQTGQTEEDASTFRFRLRQKPGRPVWTLRARPRIEDRNLYIKLDAEYPDRDGCIPRGERQFSVWQWHLRLQAEAQTPRFG